MKNTLVPGALVTARVALTANALRAFCDRRTGRSLIAFSLP